MWWLHITRNETMAMTIGMACLVLIQRGDGDDDDEDDNDNDDGQ